MTKWVTTPIYPIYRQVITHLLTIDPNFLGHPSRSWLKTAFIIPSNDLEDKHVFMCVSMEPHFFGGLLESLIDFRCIKPDRVEINDVLSYRLEFSTFSEARWVRVVGVFGSVRCLRIGRDFYKL